MDVDVVCELTDDKISSFIELFDCDFYISEPAVRDAVGQKSFFNLIHMPTSFKIDIFGQWHRCCMYLKDSFTAFNIGAVDHDLPVKSSRPE